ncbi:hypothetical protein B0H16DRAFT_1503161 [Mycena metata]|uniref:RING-type domain-containing protein n=1 Tax=Mycena metata TaxID=1033252 RepID=A0AAD7K9C2_9AGAR|nr:hypothetical protein B0H16DRAFT_1503161 [Mycena metata]
MAWYHTQFASRRFGAYTPNAVSLATLPIPDPTKPTTGGGSTPDSLFGPNIGPVPPGPAWTAATQPKRLVDPDELTTDTVRTWIEKSKQSSTATTTLQALVNLRRPTLRLSPLALTADLNPKDAPHLIEFQFDCAAPKCGVHVHVLLPPAHPDAPAHGGALRVFEGVVDGGFARALGPADAAVIELARFERVPPPAAAASGAGTSGTTTAGTTSAANATPAAAPERKRFTPFHFRRRHNTNASSHANASAAAPTPVAGAALAVVDAVGEDGKKVEMMDGDDEKGVRVTIRLVALDAEGRELEAPNEQTVYLVVGRIGAPPSSTTAPAAGAADPTPAPTEGDKKPEDKDEDKKPETEANAEGEPDADARPWLVRVVKREATIGPHTFQLHEIYGLSSAAAPAPTPAASTTYPPQPPADDPPERECLLCLSAPREVVLLPCRHLVACRPCAVNMVEFGAGGAIVAEAEEVAPAPAVPPPPASTSTSTAPGATATMGAEGATESPEGGAATATAEAAEGGSGGGGAAAAVAPVAVVGGTGTVAAARRKRKAKGWFCPVCRQPYTSLLRITTAPPPAEGAAPNAVSGGAAAGPNAGVNGGHGHGHGHGHGGGHGGGQGGAEEEEGANTNGGGGGGGGGILGGLSGLRPAFLRGLSMRERAPRDVEAQA